MFESTFDFDLCGILKLEPFSDRPRLRPSALLNAELGFGVDEVFEMLLGGVFGLIALNK